MLISFASLLIAHARSGLSVRCAQATEIASPRQLGAAEVIDALFGDVSSQRAFGRQALSQQEVEQGHMARMTELTYGEFDLGFFWELLHAAAPRPSERFVDVGSGCGRLVLAAALAHDWRLAMGIELLQGLHNLAECSYATLEREASTVDNIKLAPCAFLNEEVDTALPKLFSTGDSEAAVVFVYASCWPSVGPHLTKLSRSLAAVLPLGSRVITIDKQLVSSDETASADGAGSWRFNLVTTTTRPNYNTFESVGYVYELVTASPEAAAESGQSCSIDVSQ